METSPGLHNSTPNLKEVLLNQLLFNPQKKQTLQKSIDPIFRTNRLPSEVSQQCLDQDDHLQPSLSKLAHPAILENLKVEVSRFRNSHPEDVAKIRGNKKAAFWTFEMEAALNKNYLSLYILFI